MSWTPRQFEETTGSVRRHRRLLLAAALGAAIAIGGAIWWISTGQLNGRLAAIRARGEPVTYEELYDWIARPPSDEDATDLWLRAATELELAARSADFRRLAIFGEGPEPTPPGQPWPGFDYALEFLQANAEALRTAHEAAALGGQGDFRRYISPDGIGTLLNPIQTLRSCMRGLKLEARVFAHQGLAHEAAGSISAILRMSRALEREPFIVSQLVRLATLNTGIEEIRDTLGRLEYSDDDLVRLDSDLREIDLAAAVKLGMIGERVYILPAFSDPVTAGLPNWQAQLSRPLRGMDEGAYLDFLAEYVAVADLPWPELLVANDAIGARVKTRLTRLHVVSNLLLPAGHMFPIACGRTETQRRLAIIAIALERFRRHHGHPALDLAALVPEFLAEAPTDPTSGDAFAYIATDVRYVVYSPTKRFPLPWRDCEPQGDRETGAHPMFVYRWPPRLEEPCPPDPGAEGEDPATGDTPQEPSGGSPATPPSSIPASTAPQ